MPFLARAPPTAAPFLSVCSARARFGVSGLSKLLPGSLMSSYSGCRSCLVVFIVTELLTTFACSPTTFQSFTQKEPTNRSRSPPRLHSHFPASVKSSVTSASISGRSWVVKTFCFTCVSPGFSPDSFPYPSAAPCHHLLSAQQKIAHVLCPATSLSTGARQRHLSATRQVKKPGSSHGRLSADTSRFGFQGYSPDGSLLAHKRPPHCSLTCVICPDCQLPPCRHKRTKSEAVSENGKIKIFLH